MRRSRPVAVAVVLVLLVLAPGILPAGAQDRAPALRPFAAPAFSVNPAVPGETVKVTGRVPGKVTRPVQLERKAGTRWRVVDRGRTSRAGRYSLRLKATRQTTYRISAKKVRVRGRTFPAVVSRAATLRVQAQRVEIEAAPAPASVGEDFQVTVRATGPRRDGQRLFIEQKAGETWERVPASQPDEDDPWTKVWTHRATEVRTWVFRGRLSGGSTTAPVVSRAVEVDVRLPASAPIERVSQIDDPTANQRGGYPVGMSDDGHVAWVLPASGETGPGSTVERLFLWDTVTHMSEPTVQPPAGAIVGMSADDLEHAVIGTPADELVLWDLQTNERTTIVAGDPSLEFGDITPDGDHVVYERDVDGFPEVFLWDRGTGTTIPISDRDDEITLGPRDPQISDDGDRVVYHANAREFAGAEDAEVIARWDRGGDPEQVAEDGRRGVLSGSGAHYLLGVDGDPAELHVLDVGTGQVAAYDLPGDPTGAQVLAATPDGDTVAFAWLVNGQQVLATMTIGDGAAKVVAECAQCAPEDPFWISDDGRYVTFGTADALVPDDDNGAYDAFQWDRDAL